jgi:hypothetical protein
MRSYARQAKAMLSKYFAERVYKADFYSELKSTFCIFLGNDYNIDGKIYVLY